MEQRSRSRGRARAVDGRTDSEAQAERKRFEEEIAARAAEVKGRYEELGLDEEYEGGSVVGDPRVVARELASQGSNASMSKEFIMRTMMKMILRGASAAQMAQAFNVSMRTIFRWRSDLKAHLRDGLHNLTADDMLTDALAFHQEIRTTAMQDASRYPVHRTVVQDAPGGGQHTVQVIDKDAAKYRISMLQLAVRAETTKHLALDRLGVYEAMRYKPRQQQDEQAKRLSDMQRIVDTILDDEVGAADFIDSVEAQMEEVAATIDFNLFDKM